MAINDKHYNPMIASRLRSIASGRQWSLLCTYLETLSNAHFRTAGYLLGEEILTSLEEDKEFWEVVTLLYKYNAKAFLVTCMKAATGRVASYETKEANLLWDEISGNEIDAAKTLQTLLPSLTDDVVMVRLLLNKLMSNDARKRIALLLHIQTPAAAFMLFHALRQVEHDHALLVRTTYFLIKKGDALSFNLASLFKVFFGLDEIRGIFSLRLEPFELARLEASYDAFKRRVLNSAM